VYQRCCPANGLCISLHASWRSAFKHALGDERMALQLLIDQVCEATPRDDPYSTQHRQSVGAPIGIQTTHDDVIAGRARCSVSSTVAQSRLANGRIFLAPRTCFKRRQRCFAADRVNGAVDSAITGE